MVLWRWIWRWIWRLSLNLSPKCDDVRNEVWNFMRWIQRWIQRSSPNSSLKESRVPITCIYKKLRSFSQDTNAISWSGPFTQPDLSLWWSDWHEIKSVNFFMKLCVKRCRWLVIQNGPSWWEMGLFLALWGPLGPYGTRARIFSFPIRWIKHFQMLL